MLTTSRRALSERDPAVLLDDEDRAEVEREAVLSREGVQPGRAQERPRRRHAKEDLQRDRLRRVRLTVRVVGHLGGWLIGIVRFVRDNGEREVLAVGVGKGQTRDSSGGLAIPAIALEIFPAGKRQGQIIRSHHLRSMAQRHPQIQEFDCWLGVVTILVRCRLPWLHVE